MVSRYWKGPWKIGRMQLELVHVMTSTSGLDQIHVSIHNVCVLFCLERYVYAPQTASSHMHGDFRKGTCDIAYQIFSRPVNDPS